MSNPPIETTQAAPPDLTKISIDQFMEIALRVGEIRAAEKVEKSKKLIKMTVFDGESERTVVAAVFAGVRLDGVLIDQVRRDGANAARTLIEMIRGSKFAQHLQLVMLQGIALAGFNVVDVFALNRELGLPVLVIARKRPDLA